MASKETQGTKIALIQNDVGYLNKRFDSFEKKLDSVDEKLNSHYVSKEEFEPIKKVVYGLVGLILIAVAGAVVSLVITNR